MRQRVVVTGMGGLTALGHDWAAIAENLHAGHSGIRRMADWADITSMNTRLAAPVKAYELRGHCTRKRIRSMGPLALMAPRASDMALAEAGLLDHPVLTRGRTGVAHGA